MKLNLIFNRTYAIQLCPCAIHQILLCYKCTQPPQNLTNLKVQSVLYTICSYQSKYAMCKISEATARSCANHFLLRRYYFLGWRDFVRSSFRTTNITDYENRNRSNRHYVGHLHNLSGKSTMVIIN